LALVCYKVGAIAIRARIEALEQQVANLRERQPESLGPSEDAHLTGDPPWSL
jgi:hypothetical protein